MSSQSSHSAAASAAGCEKVVLENPLSCLSESAPSNIPLSKRIKLSEVKHNMGIENVTVNTESFDSSCSTISLPEDFDPVPALVNATEYVRKHLQQSVLRHDTELSLLSSESSHRLCVDTLENLALNSKLPPWKLDSIKAGGSLLAFGNDDGAPLSEVARPPGPRSRTEGMATMPQTFRYSPTSWKITSAEKDCFVFLETIKGVPPETVMWTDHQHGSYINPTTWVSSVRQQKGVYHYSSQTSAADKFSPIFPNYVCDDSKESAAHILVQRKGYKPQRPGADSDTKGEKRSHPADVVDGFSECPLPDKELHDPDHEMAAVGFGVGADGQHNQNPDVDVDDFSCEDFRSPAEMAESIGRQSYGFDASYDDDDDVSIATENTEDREERFPVFERSSGVGIRVIYITRDPVSRQRIVLVDHVQEEDERYRYVRDRLARSKREGVFVDSLTIDCPSITEMDLRARLHLAYDHLEERLNFLIREGKIDAETYTGLPPDAPITANEKPISLVISNDDDNHSGYDGNVNNPFNPDGNIPIHGGRCGSGRSSPRHDQPMEFEEFKSPADNGFYCRQFRIDGEMIRVSAEFDFVYIRIGRETFTYPWNTSPTVSRKEAVDLLNKVWAGPIPSAVAKFVGVGVVYEAVVEALGTIFEYGKRDVPSESSYLSGTGHPLIPVESTGPAGSIPRWHVPGDESVKNSKTLGVRGKENLLNKPVRLGDGKPLERKENLFKKLVAPESDVKLLSGGEKDNSSKQKTEGGRGELLDVISSMQEEIRRLSHQREADRREVIRMAGMISRLEGEVAELRGKLRIREEEEEEEMIAWEGGDLEGELQQWGPARGQQDQIVGEGVDLLEFDDPSDFEKVSPAEDGGDDDQVAVVTEWEPLVPILDDTTQLIVVATETGAAARILERVSGDARLCRSLVYLEVRGGRLDIVDDDFCKLIQLCPDLVGVAVRGGVNLTDVSMRCVLTSCRMICGLELSGQPSTPGQISSRPLRGIPYPWQGCSLRELVLRHQPGVEEGELKKVLEEERPCLRVTLARGGEETVFAAGSGGSLPYNDRAPGLGRWVSLRGELWEGDEAWRRSQEGIWEGVRRGVARSSVLGLLTYKPDCGGLTWMLDDYQMDGVGRRSNNPNGLNGEAMLSVKPLVVNIISWVLAAIATGFVILRFYMRNRNARFEGYKLRNCRWRVSDWIISITIFLIYLANLSDTITVVMENGLDDMNLVPDVNDSRSAYHVMSPGPLKALLKILFASLFPYYLSWWGVKIYLIVLYYKLVPQSALPKHRIALHCLAVLTVTAGITMVAANLFWCHPIGLNWDLYPTKERNCLAYFSRGAFVVTVSLHCSTEVLIFSFPFSFLHVLKRNNKQKFYAAAAMFAVGFLGVVISISRTTYIVTAHYTPIISIVNAWGTLEQTVGVVVCCLPTFKALVRRRWSKFSANRSKSTRAGVLGTRSSAQNSIFYKEYMKGGTPRTGSDFGSSSFASSSTAAAQYMGAGGRRGSVKDRESAILRVDSFERMEAIVEAEAARGRASGSLTLEEA
ncbi:hypothetical protein TWF679_002407 [Orbilia oligospora]|uniref:Rhodopsin domain-containing protein n=1 Tax=Orbilia oligospora TaxID=2813651 RepID=A0A8H8UTN2_ORBOL|nr:hypothetical protein TWF679_002407 [Orbilia oligospora]